MINYSFDNQAHHPKPLSASLSVPHHQPAPQSLPNQPPTQAPNPAPQKKPIDNPTESSRQQFEQLLTCHICFCHANAPMMCPFCSKLYCQSCIRRCLLLKSECPHCRKQIKGVSMMASCNRFVNQLVGIVNQLIDQKGQEEICQLHEVQINYFCEECVIPVCCQCQMFGQHKGHTLKRLSTIYQARYDALRQMLSQFKNKLKQKQLTLKQVQTQLLQLKKLKQKNLKQLQQFTQHYRVKILQQTTKQTTQLQQSITKYNDLIHSLNKLEQQLNVKAQQAEKAGTFALDQQLVRRIETELKVEVPRVGDGRKSVSVLEEVIPPFFEGRFVVGGFAKKKRERSTIYSPVEKCQGSEWRLKVYPNGNDTFQGTFLSIFIQMVSTIHQTTVYQYQIQLVNRTNPHQSMMRESSSTFEPGQSWGYNKYIKLENLLRQGFVDPVTDQLQIRYFIRNPFYYSIYKQKQAYIQHLDNQILGQQGEIKELEALLNGGNGN